MRSIHRTRLQHSGPVVQKRPHGGDQALCQARHCLDLVLREIADEDIDGRAIGVALVQVILQQLELLRGPTGDCPAEVGGGEEAELFGDETAGVAGGAEEDDVVLARGLFVF